MVDDEGLLLALLNTTPTISGEVTDLLADPETARAWLTEHAGEEALGEDLGLLRSTRDTLQALIHDRAAPAALAPALDGVGYRPLLDDTGLAWRLSTPRDHALAARAVVAWDALRRTAPGRLRACENTDECTLFLVDRSKSNSARWCSMAGCGNRMKARRHYERRRNTRAAD
ncbi:CGNR zinc finger domain-containing protein [Herbidospora daliensis]|uniref:CGNR zinc finger domain-containing protein n=1 Tax=Herbidospora daliensis TaxID=295585 RepID=UPI00078104EF|nr:CGNR zinc finger domain-containing protein [Herbidospora daliensis]